MVEEQSTEVAVVESKPTEVVKLTEEAIEIVKHNIDMAEKLVMEVLEEDVDYGIHPGTNSMALRDPGASKINNAFNSYPEHKILYHQETEDLITFHIQASLISRQTGNIVAVGVGACSTMETRYAFRWVENPEEYGISRQGLRPGRGKNKGKFRIPNPEVTDLGNTILLMASKRAEGDACKNLPGVGSALVKLFKPHLAKRKEPDWTGFWGRLAQMGISEEQAHEMLNVKSVKEWIDQGGTLEGAIRVISGKLTQKGAAAQKPAPAPQPEPSKGPIPPSPDKRKAADITEADIPDATALQKVAFEVFGLQPKELWDELNYSSLKNFEEAKVETAFDGWLKLKVVREGPGEESGTPDEKLWD